ncbi:MAG TPA: DUF3732 domain-containing protein [Bryobacteraceae bacterium]|nr:DUF3732 domain-containing protein [Bryobacteraceae bacterium]
MRSGTRSAISPCCGSSHEHFNSLPQNPVPRFLMIDQPSQVYFQGRTRARTRGNTLQVDVRVIAATNQDLGQMVRERKFRADLFYRLNVFPLMLPPLRERPEDIPLLAEHFVEKFAAQQGKIIDSIPEEVMAALRCHDWPGNIRELQNVIERGMIMTTGRVLSMQTVDRLTPSAVPPLRQVETADPLSIRTMADAERAHITATLRETKWKIGGPRGAAAQLGLPRTTLLYRMQRLGISNATPRRRFAQMLADLPASLNNEQAGDLQPLGALAG